MVCKSPDLAQALSVVSECMSNPSRDHGKLSNGYSGIFVRAQETRASCLKDNMEMRTSLVPLTPNMREILTSVDLLRNMFSFAMEDRYLGDLCSNRSVLCL